MILFMFFVSADPKITRSIIRKSSLHIILFLLLVYFVYNNLHLGFLLLIILGIVMYYTSFKEVIWKTLSDRSSGSSLQNWRDVFSNFSFDKIMETFTDHIMSENQLEEVKSDVNDEDEMVNHLLGELEGELTAMNQ